MKRAFTAVAALVVVLASARGKAQSRPDDHRAADPWRRVVALDLQTSVGGPLGIAGLALEITPAPVFTVSAGIGMTYDDRGTGAQESLGVRLRWPLGSSALALGGGMSTGPYERGSTSGAVGVALAGGGGGRSAPQWDRAFWGNVEASFEHRTPGGLEMRFFVGDAMLANRTADRCGPLPECRRELMAEEAMANLYAGFSIGFAFGR